MNILQKYELTFSKESNGRITTYSGKEQIIAEALEDFRYSIEEIIRNANKYLAVISENPPEKNAKGMISDEDYYKYWGTIQKINHFGSDQFYLDFNGKNAEISDQFSDWSFKLPINEIIEIFQEWKYYLDVNS